MVGRVAVLLTEFVADFVLVQEVEHVNGHPDVGKPCPFLRVRENLLFGIAIGIVDKMFGFEGARDGEGFLYEQLHTK